MVVKQRKNTIILLFFSVALLYLYSDFIAPAMDYYILQRGEGYWDFYELYYSWPNALFCKVLLLCVALIFFSFFRRVSVGVAVANVLTWGLSIADQTMYETRQELLNYRDLSLVEAAGTASNYVGIKWGYNLFVLVGVSVALFLMGIGVDILLNKQGEIKKIPMVASIGVAGIVLVGMVAFVFGWMEKQDANFYYLETKEEYCQNALFRFLENRKIDYSEGSVLEAASLFLQDDNTTGTADESVRPNVICIMNESWWDTDAVKWQDGFGWSEDPMGPMKQLKNCSKGHLSVNIYGGGTCASEYEFLLGVNSKYADGQSTVFEELLHQDEIVSVVDYFKELDYQTMVMHPYDGEFYSRDKVYQRLGFDKMIFDNDMKYTDHYAKFISDDSMMNQIIYEYENKKDDQPLFLFGVTIANHAPALDSHDGYEYNADYDFPIEIRYPENKSISDYEKMTMKTYFNGIYLSSLAFEKLITYFSQVDEPTVVLMYGDHCPCWNGEMLEHMGLSGDSLSQEDEMALYTTPVVMWKNYDNNNFSEVQFEGDQVAGAIVKLAQYAGMPTCDMFELLDQYSSYFLADTMFYLMDAERNRVTELSAEAKKVLEAYRVICYDLTKGNTVLNKIWKPKTEK